MDDRLTDPKCDLDWAGFVYSVGRDHSEGKSDEQISLAYGRKIYTWAGKIRRLKLNSEFTPGIEFEMPDASCVLRGGKLIKASYLYVGVRSGDKGLWSGFREGDRVLFEVTLQTVAGISPGIRVVSDVVDDEAILLIAAEDGKPMAVST